MPPSTATQSPKPPAEPESAFADASPVASDEESADDGSAQELDQQFASDTDKSSPSGSQTLDGRDGEGSTTLHAAARGQGSSVPVGKRRRVSRACDECVSFVPV